MISPALALIAVSGADPAAVDRLGGPVAIAGRIVGLGQAEMDAGIPKWAWAGIGLILGASVMYVARPHIESALSRARS